MEIEQMDKNSGPFPLRPVGDRFVGKVVDSEEDTHVEGDSVFLLAKRGYSKPMRVVVVEISRTFDNEGLGLKVGDEVLIPKYGSTSVTVGEDGERYQLCNRMDVIGIL